MRNRRKDLEIFHQPLNTSPKQFRHHHYIAPSEPFDLFAHPEKIDVDIVEENYDREPLQKLQSDDVVAKSGKFDSVQRESAQPHIFRPMPPIASLWHFKF
jgi:hypothetical protein